MKHDVSVVVHDLAVLRSWFEEQSGATPTCFLDAIELSEKVAELSNYLTVEIEKVTKEVNGFDPSDVADGYKYEIGYLEGQLAVLKEVADIFKDVHKEDSK